MVPRLSITSSSLMPMPLSLMLKVRAALSGVSAIDSESLPNSSGLASASKRSFSQASEAFEISSRKKISLCEYSEWMTNRSTCLVSAWNSLICGCVSVVMALQSLCYTGVLQAAGATSDMGPPRESSRYHGEKRHQCGGVGGAGGQSAGGRR